MRSLKWMFLGLAAGLFMAPGVRAEEGRGHSHGTKSESGIQSVQGEVLDMVCFMTHNGMGPKHQKCALTCLKDGAPMGLLSKDGSVYLLIEDHDAKQPYLDLKALAGEQVKVKGKVFLKGGVKAIQVLSSQKAG